MNKLVFGRMNYILLLSGIGVLFLGFFIMTMDKEPYGFGFLGITLGPAVVTLGFAIEFFAILWKDKSQQEEAPKAAKGK